MGQSRQLGILKPEGAPQISLLKMKYDYDYALDVLGQTAFERSWQLGQFSSGLETKRDGVVRDATPSLGSADSGHGESLEIPVGAVHVGDH